MSGDPRKRRVVLSGYYGFDNAGDEAVLAGLIRAFRAAPGGDEASLEITALSIHPEATARDHGIRAAHRYRFAPLLGAIWRCDLLASGGGSLLQDVTSRHSIYYYLGIARLSQLLGRRTMFIAQGIGPLNLPRSRKLTASIARRCHALTVRDNDSAALLRQLGVLRPEADVTADPAILLGAERAAERIGIGFALRASDKWPYYINTLSDAVSRTLSVTTARWITMSPEDIATHKLLWSMGEFAASRNLAAMPDIHALTWREARDEAAVCEMIIGMRLHSLILAAASGVPSVALSYDPKVNAFMEQTGQADALFDVRDKDAGKLAGIIRRVWETRRERSERLQESLPALRAAAMRNAEVALALLREDS